MNIYEDEDYTVLQMMTLTDHIVLNTKFHKNPFTESTAAGRQMERNSHSLPIRQFCESCSTSNI
jgi:hypothetical protein